ncbi:restriction endonuclease subunit S [Daejeonia sp. YH14]|uniref:restriction endonuclease subunit S n=1 Tax=Daejeonia sp. YH14 TaxID=3439042 RepID=UPI003F4966B9
MPESWEWCRLGYIGKWQSGATPNRSNKDYYNGDVLWLKTGDLTDDYIYNISETITQKALQETSVKLNPTGSVLLAMYGATIGKVGILTEPATTNQACCACSEFRGIHNIFLFYLLISYREYFIHIGEGGAQPNISKEKIISTLIPLPPLFEQQRIVSMIEQYDNLINELEGNKEDLKQFITQTKSKILDLAIRGKLVPQDPNDEPASVLLKRIKTEHPESKKKAKYTGDNSHYQNLPFEIPENWSWCRLVDICSIITDGTHQTPTYSDEGYIFLSSKNVTSGKIDWENVMYIPEFLHKQLYARLAPQKGDILLAKNGTTGFSAVVDCAYIFDIYVSLALLRTFQNKINPYYLRHIMSSLFVQEQFKANLKGIGVPNLHLENIRNTYVPICSLKEQNEIVSKIDQLFEVLDNIAAEL